jgi:Predicted O-methyltransferase
MELNEQNYVHDGERVDQLYSQNIKIIQSPEVFSFSLDAVLLADFVRPDQKAKNTGSGLMCW